MRQEKAEDVRLRWLGMLLLGLLALLLLTLLPALGQETPKTEIKKPWIGEPVEVRIFTLSKLAKILQAHALWLASKGKEGQQADLSGVCLEKVNLSWKPLNKAILSKAWIEKTDLSQAWLEGADLSGARLEEVNLSGASLKKANLGGARLEMVNLSNASLSGANLSEAKITNCDLSGASLTKANLSNASLHGQKLSGVALSGADLSGAKLDEADLSGAVIFDINLIGARLFKANLSRATLLGADLCWASLRDTNLSGTELGGANLWGAFFEPKPGTVSDVSLLLNIKGLASLRYYESSHGLVELREAYKKAGLREPERQVTFALNHNRRLKSGKLESLFNLVLFEWTCQYGMSPGQPLKFLGLGLLFFTLPYLLAFRSRDPETGIWLVLPPDRILGQGSKVRPYKLTGRTAFRPLPPGRWPRLKARLRRGLRRVRLAFYFSLLSTFNLGWRELNVGNWISRVQKLEYNLKATGWVRSVAGLQSLLSVYLLALWVLTYFGRPFD
jgi:uncharacterized protein YjbI with pentapeptide repeats